MGKSRTITTEKSIKRWIKEGRGRGNGRHYKPWLTIHDVPSIGMVHRIRGTKIGRVHHLMSKLEADYYYIFERSESVIDIREQYPLLPQEITLKLARQCGVRHPTDPRSRHPIVMTTDFLLTVQSHPRPVLMAYAVKTAAHLENSRVQEKLEIEKRYWANRGIEWRLITDRDLPDGLVQNLKLIRQYHDVSNRLNGYATQLPEIIATLNELTSNDFGQNLCQLSQSCDQHHGLPRGTSLTVIYHLLASRQWDADLTAALQPDQPIKLLVSQEAQQW